MIYIHSIYICVCVQLYKSHICRHIYIYIYTHIHIQYIHGGMHTLHVFKVTNLHAQQVLKMCLSGQRKLVAPDSSASLAKRCACTRNC